MIMGSSIDYNDQDMIIPLIYIHVVFRDSSLEVKIDKEGINLLIQVL